MPPLTIKQLMAELDDVQLAALEEVKLAKIARDNGNEILARAIRKAHKKGVSYGMMGVTLAISKESVWRQEKRTFPDD